jgi:hypothetical protein
MTGLPIKATLPAGFGGYATPQNHGLHSPATLNLVGVPNSVFAGFVQPLATPAEPKSTKPSFESMLGKTVGLVTAYALIRLLFSMTTRHSKWPAKVGDADKLIPVVRSCFGYVDGLAEQTLDEWLHEEMQGQDHAPGQLPALTALQRYGITMLVTERFEDTLHKLFRWTNTWAWPPAKGKAISTLRCALQETAGMWLVMMAGGLMALRSLYKSKNQSPSSTGGGTAHGSGDRPSGDLG